ncbi:MAG: MoaD/ThiS family protein [Actinobacteria bacterium]|nr:MoaD/ThiS family protein [Actinomycetota bacterium]
MAIVHLRHPLRGLAGDQERVEVAGEDVRVVVRELEERYPGTAGWILDETGDLRPHVSVFVGGEKARVDSKIGPDDEIYILHAISGGSDDTAELLVGTHKGLFVLRGERGGPMEVATRAFEGQDVEFAMRDPRSGTYIASVTHGQFGPRIYLSDDPTGEWSQAKGPAFPEDTGTALTRTWVVTKGEEDGVLWAGVDPAALFKSEDSGRSWELVRGLWDHPSRPDWQPGGGGLALHSICTWPGEPDRVTVGISAAGIWHTDDGGATWRRGGKGIVPRYLPDDAGEDAKMALCIHNMHRAPLEPATLYMQFHGGVYRSDDSGDNWNEIGLPSGLPSDFGFPIVVDPADPDSAYVIPLTADLDRVTEGGKLVVYETRDRGATWTARTEGLPGKDAYLTILRQSFCHDGRSPLGLYFGATSGEVFGSGDAGKTWTSVARDLAPVLSVRCSS